jgi:transposase-like protein
VQTCVVHLVRSSLRYTSKKHWGQVCREMREIYTAPTVEAAEACFGEFADTWADRYPAMIDTWRRAWAEFVPFLAFPVELRKIVYTTNAVESLNARFRKASATGPTSPTSNRR